MTYLAAAWAWFTGLSIVAKVGGGVAALGILSPVTSALTFVWTVLKAIITWIFDGFQNVVAHPVTLSIVMLAWLGGLYQGIEWDKHKVAMAKMQAAVLVKKVQGAADVETAKAKAAIAAREAAKTLPLIEPIVPVVAPASVPTVALDPARPDSVRPNKVRSRPKCTAMFCF
jgi:hypothetical protein